MRLGLLRLALPRLGCPWRIQNQAFRTTMVAGLLVVGCALWPSSVEARPKPAADPEISFQETTVSIAVAPGAEIAWCSFAREFEDRAMYRVTRTDISVDDDGDGWIVLDLEGPVPEQSVWFAADLDTNAFHVAAPEGSPAVRADFPPGAVRPGPVLDDFVASRAGVEIFLVRRKKGAWALTVRDGRDGDGDGSPDGSVTASVEDFEPVAESPSLHPALFKPKDVVVTIDRASLRISASSVEDAHHGGS